MQVLRCARGRRDSRGAAAVEFALVMVPFMLILLGVISWGFMLSFRQSVSQAAAEGARAAAVAPATADRQAIATAAIANAMGVTCGSGYLTCTFPSVLTPATATSPAKTCPTTSICVRVTYAYSDDPSKPIFPGSQIAIPDQLSYTAVAEIAQ